jgi:CBS domain-containing protein
MKYLTQIIGKPVRQTDGSPVGKVTEVIALLSDRFPILAAVQVHHKNGDLYIPFDCIEFDKDPEGPQGTGYIQGDIRLRIPLNEVEHYQTPEQALHLRQDVLDRQIVDVHDFRVVRVNDVRIAECGGGYCVVGVDASLRAMLRRVGGTMSRPVESIATLIKKPLRSNLIAWDDMQALEPGTNDGRIRLKVSHDKIARLHPVDIAEIVSQLSPQQRAEVFDALDMETVAETLAEVEPEMQVEILQQLDKERASDILAQMEPDDAADLLDDMPEHQSDELLEQMEPEEAEAINRLLAYDEDTAGGLMTTEFVAIPADLTCEQTIQRLREIAPRAEMIYYVYVVDEDERLVGVLSLRDLVVSPPETRIHSIMVKKVIRVYLEDHADDIAQVIGRYNLLAAPVVDEDERLQGIITVDDTLERLLPQDRRRRPPYQRDSDE